MIKIETSNTEERRNEENAWGRQCIENKNQKGQNYHQPYAHMYAFCCQAVNMVNKTCCELNLFSNTLYCFYHDIAKLIIRSKDVSRFTISCHFFHFLFRWHEMAHSKLILPERNRKETNKSREKNSTILTSMSMIKKTLHSNLQSILKGFHDFVVGSFPLFYVFDQNTPKILKISNEIVS